MSYKQLRNKIWCISNTHFTEIIFYPYFYYIKRRVHKQFYGGDSDLFIYTLCTRLIHFINQQYNKPWQINNSKSLKSVDIQVNIYNNGLIRFDHMAGRLIALKI